MKELDIPYPVLKEDDDAFEVLRVWGSRKSGALYVSVASNLGGGAEGYGVLMSDLLLHGAKLYAEREGISEEAAVQKILESAIKATGERNISGGIPQLS